MNFTIKNRIVTIKSRTHAYQTCCWNTFKGHDIMNSFRVQVREDPEAAGTESVGFLVKQLVCYHIISLFFPSNHYSTLLNINTYHHYLSTRLTMTIQYPSDLYMYLPLPSTIFHGALPFPRAPGACGRFPSAGAVRRPGG